MNIGTMTNASENVLIPNLNFFSLNNNNQKLLPFCLPLFAPLKKTPQGVVNFYYFSIFLKIIEIKFGNYKMTELKYSRSNCEIKWS